MASPPPTWVDVRCPSPTCDRAAIGGRLLFKRSGDVFIHATKNSSVVFSDLYGVICCCGAHWKREDLLKEDG